MNILLKNGKYTLSAMALIVVLCGTAFFSSCSDEFLKPTPLSFYEPGVTLSSESGMRASMAIADRTIRNYWTHSTNNIGHNANPLGTEYQFSELMAFGKTDNSATGLDFMIGTALSPQNAGSGPGDTDGNTIRFFWEETYNGMKHANTIIDYIDKVENMSEKSKKEYLGRALFHRAFRYYALVFQYGDVPLITKIPSVPKFNYRSTKKEAILEMITLDLEKAVEYVPNQSDMEYKGMINKGACRMLLIKCYLATGQWQKAKEQADILIDGSGYALVNGGAGLGQFGEWIPGGEPETWPITRNVIWDLHRSENKLHAQNTETILAMPNRGLQAESFRQWLQMRIYGPFWQTNTLQSPDRVAAVLNHTRSQASYNKQLDFLRAIGRGIGCMRPTYFAQFSLWEVNGVNDEGDLRHRNDVGNWLKMTDIKYNNPASAYYGKNLMLYHPETGAILCSDTIRSWYDTPHYKHWNLDVGNEANPNANQFNGATGGATGGHGDIYVYRLAETYLLRAEAKFYLGDIAGATADVNKIRERARCARLYTTVNIGDIMNERARELHMEEWRNVELSRVSRCLALSGKPDEWGNTYDINTYDKQKGRDAAGGSYWWQRIVHYNNFYNSPSNPFNQNNRTQSYTLDKYNFYWPIRQDVLNSNREGKLMQAFGYAGYDASTPMWETWQEAVADEDKID